jgi:hypothetical protein
MGLSQGQNERANESLIIGVSNHFELRNPDSGIKGFESGNSFRFRQGGVYEPSIYFGEK